MNPKLLQLTQGARYDLSCACGPAEISARRRIEDRWIYPAVLPDGRKIPLLKILFTNDCRNDCLYCENRRSNRELRRYSFTPEELVQTFLALKNQGRVAGLFLSSGVVGNHIMEKMLMAVENLRERHRFKGYIHLKVLPGSSPDLLTRAVELSNRVSLNLEGPHADCLKNLCPEKDFETDLLKPIVQLKEIMKKAGKKCDQTTQFVVGLGGEKDREIVGRTGELYRSLKLSRVYYSSFQPPPGKLWRDFSPVSPWREIRLYQADFLLRKYGFSDGELCYTGEGNFPLKTDPKTFWALNHPENFPVEINRADFLQLLRIPGIGPVLGKKILEVRKEFKLTESAQLEKLGVNLKAALPYVLLNGKLPQITRQLDLWQER